MKKNKFALHILALGLILLSFIACDKDFTTIESDIINSDNATNFEILNGPQDVIAYTEALEPVQTNNLSLSTLGYYNDIYGSTTSSFVTQLSATSYDPDFGVDDGAFVAMDSVVLTLPFYSTVTDVEDDGTVIYEVDSVFPKADTYNPIKLNIFESNYFIRDFNPNADFNESQAYFSNKSASTTELITDAALEGEELIIFGDQQTSHLAGNIININQSGFVLEEDDEDGEPEVTQRVAPGVRVKLDTTYWRTKIINKEGSADLSTASNFAEYFRGLYFKAEAVNNDGSFLILNTASQNANITIYYTRFTASETDDADATEQGTYTLSFGQNRINFIDNNFALPLNDGDAINGDSRLYVKGGEGSVAKVKLFAGSDIDDDDSVDTPFEEWKNKFVVTEAGKFVKSKRLVNEANLVFYVDQDIVDGNEPHRLYIYDAKNNTPLIDYYLDGLSNNFPEFSVVNHLGPLQREETDPNRGIKYKLKITEHINNLLLRDSTNVELGVAVSLNVNLEESFSQLKEQNISGSDDDSDSKLPLSSVLSPRGTVLYGNNTSATDQTKKVSLEIHYTCLQSNEDCDTSN